MTTEPTTLPSRSAGRGLYWAGIGLFVVAIVLMFIQYGLKILVVPWYVPALTTVGALLLFASLMKRFGIFRIVAFGLMAALAGFLWFFMISLARLPDYEGPAKVGQKLPAFQTAMASGNAFTDKDLEAGKPSVLVFFRGRW